MRRLAWLMAVVLLCATPCRTLADSHRLYGYVQYSASCMSIPDDDPAAYRHSQCAIGVAINVSQKSMKIRPVHGHPLSVRFTDATEFETDSGEGVLDGLVAGDYVCVAYMPRTGTPTALLVVFDPKSIPCHSKKHVFVLKRGSSDARPP
jgi:hypothetical protein